MPFISSSFLLNPKLFFPTVLLLVFVTQNGFAQTTDTITLIKQLNAKHKYHSTEKLLKRYVPNHPGNLNAKWIYAQTAFWTNNWKLSKQLYEEAIRQFPTNYYLKLDYAKKLLEAAAYKQAKNLLDAYWLYDSTSNDLLTAYAKIDFYQLRLKESKKIVDWVLQKDKNNTQAQELKRDILNTEAPWLSVNTGFQIDDQPLKSIPTVIEAGKFFTPLAAAYISVSAPVFFNDGKVQTSQWISAGNKFQFTKIALRVNINAGYLRCADGENSWIGMVEVQKTFVRHLVLNMLASHQPYYYTLSSLTASVIPYHYTASLGWNNLESWNGKATFSFDHFITSQNYVYSINGWFLAPPLKVSVFDFRIGYAYNFSSSKQNRFVAKESLSEIITNYNSSSAIEGIYNPIFTPYNQSTHAVLASVNIHPHKQIELGVNANVGFYGTTKNPYLFLNLNSNNAVYVDRGYSNILFFPDEVTAFIAVKISPQVALRATYSFLHNNFYNSHYAGLSLNASFWNEKRK